MVMDNYSVRIIHGGDKSQGFVLVGDLGLRLLLQTGKAVSQRVRILYMTEF